MTSIECRRLVVRYGAHAALDGLELSLAAGEWAVLMGPSASGKTTLLRAIAGLEPVAGGKLRLGGEDAAARPPHARGVGLLFQEPSLWPHLSARANVELALAGGRAARRAEAHGWLERLGVAHLPGRFAAGISGGERRLVELARTLASRPRVLLLDEPTAHLDLHLRGELLARLRALHAELGLTTLLVTHDPPPGLAAHDRLLLIERGRLIHDAPLAQLAAAPDTDYTRELRRRLAAPAGLGY